MLLSISGKVTKKLIILTTFNLFQIYLLHSNNAFIWHYYETDMHRPAEAAFIDVLLLVKVEKPHAAGPDL